MAPEAGDCPSNCIDAACVCVSCAGSRRRFTEDNENKQDEPGNSINLTREARRDFRSYSTLPEQQQ